MPTQTDHELFERSLEILFYHGQLPAVGLTGVSMVVAGWLTKTNEWFPIVVLIVLGVGSFIGSLFAIFNKSRKQKIAVGWLVLSLLFAITYLHKLVGLTGGSESVFLHFYLYMPAVVLMIAQQRRWAELTTFGLVLCSYTLHVANHPKAWPSWNATVESGFFFLVEIFFFALFCALLYRVNSRMEKLMKEMVADATS